MYIYNSEGEYIVEIEQGTTEKIKKQYGKNIYIINEYLGEKAIIENKQIRAETRLDRVLKGKEELQEGEYIENKEIKYKEKPNNFHFWDSNKEEWVYDQELEIKALEEELGSLEGELSGLYDELDKAVARKLKMREKQLNTNIDDLNHKINDKYKRLEELEG